MHVNRRLDCPAACTLKSSSQTHLAKMSYSKCSPTNCPDKCSPLPKRLQRMRTGTEGAKGNLSAQLASSGEAQCQHHSAVETICIYSRLPIHKKKMRKFIGRKEMCTQYILLKEAASKQSRLLDFQIYFTLHDEPERSRGFAL